MTFPATRSCSSGIPGRGWRSSGSRRSGRRTRCGRLGRGEELRLLLDRAAALAGRRGYLAWEYLFSFGSGRAPWASGMAQGTGIQAFTRGAQLLGNPGVPGDRPQALGAFETPPPEGVAVPSAAGATTSCTPTRRACAC